MNLDSLKTGFKGTFDKLKTKKPSKKTLIIVIVLCVGAVALYVGFFKKDDKAQLATQSITRINIDQSIEAVGEVYAKEQVDVGAQVSGQITKLYVQIGDKVKAGD